MPKNIDVDVTVQLMNERLAYQYASIVNTETGIDILQKTIDDDMVLTNYNGQVSDTQVEITIDMNDLYNVDPTVSSIRELWNQSYTLVLPNRTEFSHGDQGFLFVQNQTDYISKLRDNMKQDMFEQNSRSRYPKNTLVGEFKTIQQIKDILGITPLEQTVSRIDQNLEALLNFMSNDLIPALSSHYDYLRQLWGTVFIESVLPFPDVPTFIQEYQENQ